MKKKSRKFLAAAAQFTPVFLDKKATTEKACELILQAGKKGIRLLVFPEAFLPGYPDWVWCIPPGKKAMTNQVFEILMENSVSVPDETTKKLCAAAKKAGVFVLMGMHERNIEASGASLYNSLLYISDQGEILGSHRKLIPTGGERLVWAPGNGSTLHSFETTLGKIGGLICWENYMPLARNSMYVAGVQLYAAPTWDHGEIWQASMQHIAKEGGMFVISSCMPLRKKDIPAKYDFRKLYAVEKDWINPGDSCIVGPDGKLLAGPLGNKEGFVTAEIDLSRIPAMKWILDTAGHYARGDVFRFSVNRDPNKLMTNPD